MKRNKVEHDTWFVYVIYFGDKYYYGLTTDLQKRKMSHHYNVKRAFEGYTNGYANLKVHVAGAAYFKKNYSKRYDRIDHILYLRLSVCFKSKYKELAKEVECFLINISLHDKNCLNTQPGRILKTKNYDNPTGRKMAKVA